MNRQPCTLTGFFTGERRKTNLPEAYSVAVSDLAFPPEIASELQALSRQSLYEISEGLFRLFSGEFQNNEQVFVQAFLDMVSGIPKKRKCRSDPLPEVVG